MDAKSKDPMELAVRAFKAAAQIPVEQGMRHVNDVFGMYYSCLWRSEDGSEMVQGTARRIADSDDAYLVCILLRIPVQLPQVGALPILPWYRVSSVESDEPIVEEVKGFEFSIG